jgi:hypothetical protein
MARYARVHARMPEYRILIEGQLNPEWQDFFSPLELTNQSDGRLLLSGRIPDPATLYGILIQISRLNLVLISVQSVNPKDPSNPSDCGEDPTDHHRNSA